MSPTAPALCDFSRRLRDIDRHNGHRSVVVISGSRDWSLSMLAALMEDFAAGSSVTVDQVPLLGRPVWQRGNVLDLLGSEGWLAGIDAWQHSAINDWLAAAGTLRAGGQLVIACPALDQWPAHFSALRRQAGYGEHFSGFIQRLCRQMLASPAVKWVVADAPLPELPQAQSGPWQRSLPSPEQLSVIGAIDRVARGRNWRPLVIRADRGRGKTAALGIAAAGMLSASRPMKILLCSLRRESVETAFRHAGALVPDAQRQGDALKLGSSQLQFMHPEQALAEVAEEWNVVMVDEAARLAPGLLQQFLERFPRLVFATTVQGYEGSGRGFDLRFAKMLDRLRPHWRRAGLKAPMRWSADDPLERFLNDAFVLDNDGEGEQCPARDFGSPITFHWLDKGRLLADEALLRQVFGLLLQAHYQSEPSDLQLLLDSDSRVLVASSDDRVLAVCQVFVEGCSDDELIGEIIEGRRRPLGNLASQRLALQFAEPQFLRQPSWRVNRIAVAASHRERGIGAGLLEALGQQAEAEGVAYLSVSFAIAEEVLRFWRRAGFSPLYLGSRVDASSGSYSLVVVKPLSEDIAGPAGLASGRLLADLPLALPGVYPKMRVGELAELLEMFCLPRADPEDCRQIRRYHSGALIFEQALPALWRFCLSADARSMATAALWPLLDKALRHHPWDTLCRRYGFTGRGQAEAAIRAGLSSTFIEEK